MASRERRRAPRRALALVLGAASVRAQVQTLLSMPCPNLCSGHGWCDGGDRRCQCFAGYQGADCSEMGCPSGPAWADEADALTDTDVAHHEAECSRRGLCVTGQCVCAEGWTGAACERKACPNACNGHGRCVSMEYYATTVDPCEGLDEYTFSKGGATPSILTYDGVWDAEAMHGCLCDEGYEGHECLLKKCPVGDDPLPSSTAGRTVQRITCSADGGSFALRFRGHWTEPVTHGANAATLQAALNKLPSITTPPAQSLYSGVTVSTSSQFVCDTNGVAVDISFDADYGPLPLLFANLDQLTLTGGTPSVHVATRTRATKQALTCSSRGVCDTETGTCTCDLGCGEGCFSTSNGFGGQGGRGDCGFRDGAVTGEVILPDCPGEVACNDKGRCDATTFDCACQDGYSGADCTLMTCPRGRSWFATPTSEADDAHLQLTECSDMGNCNRDYGECECAAGFEGAACQYLRCPGADSEGACTNHGECLSLKFLAEAATDNGVATSVTYGATPNDKYRWDFEAIRGCKCQHGYTGWDCSLKECAFGDDPLSTAGQFNEIQNLNCDLDDDTASSVTFTFREQVTDALDPTTLTLGQLEAALEALESIDDVRVSSSFVGGDDDAQLVCSNAGTDTLVEFRRPTGDVPLLQVSDASTLTVSDYRQGTKEWEECSGRGLCDRAEGTCTCFEGYGSSDGQGGPGPYEDCGYPIPVVTAMAQLVGNTQ